MWVVWVGWELRLREGRGTSNDVEAVVIQGERERKRARGETVRNTQTRPPRSAVLYRGTSLIRSSVPLGPYSRPMPRALWCSYGGGAGSYEREEGVRRWDTPLSSEYGTCKTVKARFWPWPSGQSPQNLVRCSSLGGGRARLGVEDETGPPRSRKPTGVPR